MEPGHNRPSMIEPILKWFLGVFFAVDVLLAGPGLASELGLDLPDGLSQIEPHALLERGSKLVDHMVRAFEEGANSVDLQPAQIASNGANAVISVYAPMVANPTLVPTEFSQSGATPEEKNPPATSAPDDPGAPSPTLIPEVSQTSTPTLGPSAVASLTSTPAYSPTPTATFFYSQTPAATTSGTPYLSPTATLTPSRTKTPTSMPQESTATPLPDGSYYVSMDGNDSNPGTIDRPWRTLGRVQASSFLPGDLVHFQRGGTWSGSLIIDESGLEGNPITFSAYGSGTAPMLNSPGGPGTASPIEVRADWIVVEGFLVSDAFSAGVFISQGSDHNIIRDTEVTSSGFGVVVSGQYNLITRNYIHDLNMVNNTPAGDDDYGAVGVMIHNSDNEISHNKMDRCRAPSHDYGWDGGAVEWYVVDGTIHNTYVHHNLAIDSDGFFEVGSDGGEVQDTIVAYNVSVNNGWFGQFSLSGKFGTNVIDYRIENNTIVQTSPQINGRDLPIIILTDSPIPDSISLRNNLIFSDGWDIVHRSGLAHGNNIYFLSSGAELGFSPAESEMVTDPLFEDTSAQDYHLRADSPAIDAGVPLGYSRDFDGNHVPSGTAPDIGAFEYAR